MSSSYDFRYENLLQRNINNSNVKRKPECNKRSARSLSTQLLSDPTAGQNFGKRVILINHLFFTVTKSNFSTDVLARISIEIRKLHAEGRLPGPRQESSPLSNPPAGSGGAAWPPPGVQSQRTNSRGDSAWLGRPRCSSRWSRSVSTLAAKSHSSLGLLEILICPLERKEHIKIGYHGKKKLLKTLQEKSNGTQNFSS